MPKSTFSAFGLKDVAICAVPTAPATTPVWIDVPAVESAAFKLDVGEVEQWGDDKYLGTFYHSQKGSITVKANKIAMNVLEALSGNAVTSSGSQERILFGTEDELFPPRVMVRGTTTIRLEDGTVADMVCYFYNTSVKTVWDGLPGSERAKLTQVNLMFNTFASTQDEKGDAVPGGKSAHGHFTIK